MAGPIIRMMQIFSIKKVYRPRPLGRTPGRVRRKQTKIFSADDILTLAFRNCSKIPQGMLTLFCILEGSKTGSMKLIFLLFSSLFLSQDQIPFKSNDEFELKLALEFKKRPMADVNTIDLERRTLPSTGGMPAPYLYINLKVLKVIPEEVRVKVTKNPNETLLHRKFDPSVVIKLDLGFTDDIKDRVSAHQYIITYLSKQKTPLSKIEIFFEKDGTYLVNGEKRGKF